MEAKVRTPRPLRTRHADPSAIPQEPGGRTNVPTFASCCPCSPWAMWGSHVGLLQENSALGNIPDCKFQRTLQPIEGNSCNFVSHKWLQGKSGSTFRPGNTFLRGRRTMAMKRPVFPSPLSQRNGPRAGKVVFSPPAVLRSSQLNKLKYSLGSDDSQRGKQQFCLQRDRT